MWLFQINPNSYVSDYQSYDKLNKVAFDILMFPEKKYPRSIYFGLTGGMSN